MFEVYLNMKFFSGDTSARIIRKQHTTISKNLNVPCTPATLWLLRESQVGFPSKVAEGSVTNVG